MRLLFLAAVALLLSACATAPGAAPAPGTSPVLTAVLTEITPQQARAPRQGGSAVVLLAEPASSNAASRNLALCRALFLTFETATPDEIAIGVRHSGEGLELLRPIYWLTRVPVGAGAGLDQCDRRLQAYDFPRRQVIARKFNLSGPGPFLVVEEAGAGESERLAAVIDLSRTPAGQFDEAVAYFRDGFAHRGDIWRPESYAPVSADGAVIAYVGAPAGFLPQLIRAAGVAACPFANLLDVCRN